MDRNLTEQLKKLSKELAETQSVVKHHSADYSEEQIESFNARIEDIQDEIWDIEDILREDAENEYGDLHAKGWN